MEISLFKWNDDILDHIANHGITPEEIEAAAFDGKPHIRKGRRGRRYLYSQTSEGRYLFIIYILADHGAAKIITARDMDTKEKKLYSRRGK